MTNSRNRFFFRATLVSSGLVAAMLAVPTTGAWAQTKGASVPMAGAAQDNTPTRALPVKAVTLFSSGVSFTLREGEVTGKATVPLQFRTTQINDILKSLVLLDENGTVRPAVLQSKDPIGRTLSGFAVDVSRPPSLADLLNQLRGAKVVVEAGGTVIAASTQTEKRTLQGQIVGVEGSDRGNGGFGGANAAYLSVLGDNGLQTVRLSEVTSVRLLDERLNQEFKDALSLLAAGSDDKRRTVALQFDGKGTRRVRVGYVGEAPLWKISYRLLLGNGGISGTGGSGDDRKSSAPYLQGWAMVENTTDDDWQNVQLSLVSGRPVSFIQDMYQPLYVPRPVVPPDVIASPYPQLAEGSIDDNRSDAPMKAGTENRPVIAGRRGGVSNGFAGGLGGGGFGGGVPGSLGAPAPAAPNLISSDADNSLIVDYAARGSVVAQASGEAAGELFRYNITTPVTLPRQQAALIPVIAQDVKGEKVSVFNADSGSRFPLNAVRLINNTSLHLKGGPVTIFDDGVYAGDARMENVPPGDNRLLTYAVDLSVEGERQNQGSSQTETSVSIRRGVLITARREKQETTYSFKNKSDKTRTILVEHPFSADYTLIAPAKADERTAKVYRFPVTVAPGKTEKLSVVLEKPIYESVELINLDIDGLLVFVQRKGISADLKTALEEVVTRRRKIGDLRSRATSMDAEIDGINKDQERIRKNMEALDRTSALYKRYVTQLDAQESRIQKLRDESARLKNEAGDTERNLRAYLDGLNVSS